MLLCYTADESIAQKPIYNANGTRYENYPFLLEREVDHGDSMDNRGVINAGDVQWMTAGSGKIYQEMPRGDHKGRL
jgi:Pirin